ncbi:hypothetical protein QR680_003926 [Steinernema hermaphroditum]|uniref:Uncharacterized protein n=1 Tax=Steinernema hermaphroditum TaxID=289476 RepID=A0AA39HN54_9BILA|nr:hypothetical protein QR680_003926 [Steinernema hermaphroditum]
MSNERIPEFEVFENENQSRGKPLILKVKFLLHRLLYFEEILTVSHLLVIKNGLELEHAVSEMCSVFNHYFKEGKITIGNASDHQISIQVHYDHSKKSMFGKKLMSVSFDVPDEAPVEDESNRHATVAPGDSAEFPVPPGIVKAKIGVTIYSQPYVHRSVPWERKLICRNYSMKRGEGIIISSEEKVLTTTKGEVWTDTDGKDHKRTVSIEIPCKTNVFNSGLDDVYVMVEPDEKYFKCVSDKFEEDIGKKERDFGEWKDIVKIAPGETHEFEYTVADGEANVFVKIFQQKEASQHPTHFNIESETITAGRNVIIEQDGTVDLAKDGETTIDEHGHDKSKRKDSKYNPHAVVNISNGCRYLLYAAVHTLPTKLNDMADIMRNTIPVDGRIQSESIGFKEVVPGKFENFGRDETGHGCLMYISVFYLNPKSRGDRLIEICHNYRINSNRSVIIGVNKEILEAAKGKLWDDVHGCNHFPLHSLRRGSVY